MTETRKKAAKEPEPPREVASSTNSANLVQLLSPPSQRDLEEALAKCRECAGQTIDLSFRGGDQRSESTFLLSVTCSKTDGTLEWNFRMPGSSKSRPSWKFLGDGVEIVLEHVLRQSGGLRPIASEPESPVFPSLGNLKGDTRRGAKSAKLPKGEQSAPPVQFDAEIIESQRKLLCNQVTGLISTEWLLYSIEQERCRYTACETPFALAVMSLTMPELPLSELLSESAIAEIARRISKATRKIDLFTHCGVKNFALLMPHTDLAAATIVANRVIKLLSSTPILTRTPKSTLKVALGLACLPEDVNEPGSLIAGAERALREAESARRNFATFHELLTAQRAANLK